MDTKELLIGIFIALLCLAAGFAIGANAQARAAIEACQKAGVAQMNGDYYSCTMVKK